MKICTKCKQIKPYEAFSKLTKAKDGHQYQCKVCKLELQKNNPNRKNVTKKYRDSNKEVCNARSIESQHKKLDHYRKKQSEWQKQNRDRVNKNRRIAYAKNAAKEIEKVRRRTARIKGNQLEVEFQAEVDGIYMFCSLFKGFEVDHIIPLNGKLVSGLHVPSNLQVLPITENRSKGNKYEVL